MFAKPFRTLFGTPWLTFNRLLTFYFLNRQVRKPPGRMQYVPDPGSMLYVPASSLPYHITGYTNRTHEVIRALCKAGVEVSVLTRPGYPWDRKDRLKEPGDAGSVVDGIEYEHVKDPSKRRPVLQFAVQAAKVIANVAREKKVSVIHAASNHTNALPALLAARRLGIPFFYEMRGLWELTRVSRKPQFENTPGFRQGLDLEGLVALHADRLFVISEQLGNYARENWGIPPERITLLPNCVDPERIAPTDPKHMEPNTIGYAGSLMSYEGLDTLIEAIDILTKRSGVGVQVKIIGDGESKNELEELVHRLGLSNHIRFFGKVPPESAREILNRCALVCIPRKPFTVCEIIPPIKLVEALAMAKPVIVPDLPVFRDELGDDPTGWFFNAGDAVDLARVIDEAFKDIEMLAELGKRAREYAITKRCWHDFVTEVLPVHGMVG